MRTIVVCVVALAACEPKRCPDVGTQDAASATVPATRKISKLRIDMIVGGTKHHDDLPNGPVTMSDPRFRCEIAPGLPPATPGDRSIYCYKGTATTFMHFHCPKTAMETGPEDEVEAGTLAIDADRGGQGSVFHAFRGACLYR